MNNRFIHGNWTHMFSVNGPEMTLRFVFDLEQNKIVKMEVRRATGWANASHDEIRDVEDSLKNANDDALTDPVGWGLEASDAPPVWEEAEELEEPEAPARKSVTVYSWLDLAQFGINCLTGEACAYSMRLLCDVNEDGKNLLADYFGMPHIELARAWNSQVNGQLAVGSIMLTRDQLRPLAQFALFNDGALAVVTAGDNGLIGVFDKGLLARYLAEPQIAHLHVVRNPAASSSAPHIGSRNVHGMTGRTV